MNKMHIVIILSVVVLSIQNLYSQNIVKKEAQLFRISGDAILRVQPDQIVVNFGIKLRGEELVNIKEKSSKIMNKAIKYCKEQNIPEKYIQTDFIRINPQYNYESYKSKNNMTINYYEVVQTITVIIEDLGKYEQILTDLLSLGINKVNNITFRTTKLKENRYKVRQMAIEVAKEKAKFLTSKVGLELGNIINISEYTYLPVNSLSRNTYANVSQNIYTNIDEGMLSKGLSIGMLSLKAAVNLTYELK